MTTFKNNATSLYILIIGIVLTFLVAYYTKINVEEQAYLEYKSACNEIKLKITSRLQAHAQLLRSASALFTASESVTRNEWKLFYARLFLHENLPGVQGIGFSQIVLANQLQQHIQKIRSEGFPDYTIRPTDEREIYTSIIYLEPFTGRNLRAFGYDMFSEPVRRKMLEDARDSDIASLSGKVTLVQETNQDVQAGTLMCVPVYRNKMPINTLNERRAAIIGWVYSPYRMNDLMTGILDDQYIYQRDSIRLQIFDESISADSLLFDSQNIDMLKKINIDEKSISIPIEFNGKRWILYFTKLNPQNALFQSKVMIVFLSGNIISLLLFFLLISLFNTNQRAQKIAEQLTSELKGRELILIDSYQKLQASEEEVSAANEELQATTDALIESNEELMKAKEKVEANEQKLKEAQQLAKIGNWELDLINNKSYWSDEIFRIFGCQPQEFGATYEAFLSYIHPDDRDLVNAAYTNHLKTKQPYNITHRILLPNGILKYVNEQCKSDFDENDKPIRSIGTVADITGSILFQNELKKWEALFQHAKWGIAIGSSDKKSFDLVNPEFAAMHGFTAEELIGKPVHELFAPESRADIQPNINLTHEKGHHIWESVHIRKDNSKFPVLIDLTAIKDTNGNVLHRIANIQDITERKKAEEALKLSEEKFSKAFNSSPIPLVFSRLSDGKYFACNDAFIKLTGYDFNEITSKSSDELNFWITPDERQKFIAKLKTETYVRNYECNFRVKNDKIITTLMSNEIVVLNNEDCMLTVLLDITEQKKSEDRFQSLIENAPIAIGISVNLKYVYVNKIYFDVTGYTAEELLGKDITFLITPESLAEFSERAKKRYQGLPVENTYEVTIIKKNNSRAIVLMSASLIDYKNEKATFGFMQDITDRKKAELELEKYRNHLEDLIEERTKELTESKEHFETLFNTNPDAVQITRMTDYIVTNVNENYTKIYGYTREDIVGKKNTDVDLLINQDDRLKIIDLLKKQQFYENIEVEFRRKDQSIFFGMMSGKIFTIQNIPYLISVTRDISDRKKIEKELLFAKEQAEIANQTKSEFLSNMSHELRTPLNAILGFSKLLKYQKNITDTQKEQLITIHQCGEHLLSLINDILDMSKIEARKLELQNTDVNLPVLLYTIFNINKIKADEKDLEYELEKKVSLPTYVFGDERKLKQIMLNLIGNAIKFTDEGKITVRVDYIDSENIFVFEVEDTGYGIPEEMKDEIFRPFIQHKGKNNFSEGTGLGLSITKQLIEMMDGTISLESEVDKGSIFRVEIPLQTISEKKHKINETELLMTGYKGDRKKILIVDDNQTSATMLGAILEQIDFKVEFAENGLLALKKMNDFKPHLTLLDYRMPVMDGIKFVQNVKLNPEFDSAKIIGVSASFHQKELKMQFRYFCDDFIQKPVDIGLLLTKIQENLGIEWLYDNTIEQDNFDETTSDMFYPDKSIILMIKNYIEIGNYNGINNILEKLMIEDTKYNNFCMRIKKFTKEYNSEALLDFLSDKL